MVLGGWRSFLLLVSTRFCFPNTDHVTKPRRFEPLLCSLKRPRASMKMSHFERKYSPEYRHLICIGKTKSTSEKGLLGL